MISDFYLSVSNCSDVQGAQRVMVQSENRLGFKDYHENPKEVRKLYERLDNKTDIKSLLFCEWLNFINQRFALPRNILSTKSGNIGRT